MMKPTQILLSSIFVLLLSTGLWAQQGTIRGTVSDKSTGEVLMFSNVVVKGTDPIIGGQTDLDGNYTIKLAPGTYDLEFSYVGYTTQTVTGVEVKENDITIFDFLMSSDAVELDLDIVVQAERIDRTENALLVLQMKAPAIQDGISAQEISRYGSSNAAESMKRVTGASVQDGRYIVVRGLGDRYSNAQLNGLQLPSTDPYRNSTQLDLIPANVLDNVIASKTFTPDMPGNFAGGNVNIKTKSFPERFTLSASLSASYNTQSSFIDDFLTHQGGDTDWLGYDDGTRD
ncbi:MAG: carboxypeptidase-like regulatory domain-containing protein, partial [Bacteroidota bacterium]